MWECLPAKANFKEDDGLFRSNEERRMPWEERTLWTLREQRFERTAHALGTLRVQAMEEMDMRELTQRIEACWQDIPRKPLRTQQAAVARDAVLRAMPRQADCLSQEEHALCERLLLAEGSVCLRNAQELDAARALSLRLFVHAGVKDGRPMAVLDPYFAGALERALSREAHARVRMRLFAFQATVCAALYLAGALDDRAPQRLFTSQVLGLEEPDEEALALARHYLWASFDCEDYEDGVLLVHPALADPQAIVKNGGAHLTGFTARELLGGMQGILPQEEPYDEALKRAIGDALRPGVDLDEGVRSLRLLCKQDAPMDALEEVLDSLLMVRRTERMQSALQALHAGAVRWNGAQACASVLQ
jgi:hypothetical protein